MLNTKIAQNGNIEVTDDNGQMVASISYDARIKPIWVVILENNFDGRSRMDIVKGFHSRQAADYYVLAAYLEATAG